MDRAKRERVCWGDAGYIADNIHRHDQHNQCMNSIGGMVCQSIYSKSSQCFNLWAKQHSGSPFQTHTKFWNPKSVDLCGKLWRLHRFEMYDINDTHGSLMFIVHCHASLKPQCQAISTRCHRSCWERGTSKCPRNGQLCSCRWEVPGCQCQKICQTHRFVWDLS